MIIYKIDVIQELKKAGYNTTRIRKEHVISEASLQKIREGKIIAAATLDHLCRVLNLQPGDILEYVPNSEGEPERQIVTSEPENKAPPFEELIRDIQTVIDKYK